MQLVLEKERPRLTLEHWKFLITDGCKLPPMRRGIQVKFISEIPRISPGSQECLDLVPKLFFKSFSKKIGSLVFRTRERGKDK